MSNDILHRVKILGSGPAGATTARILAEAGHQVDLFEKRPHLAGNCFDKKDENGVFIHMYGPHYFRTNSDELLNWLSRFTNWIPGKYYVQADIGDRLVPLPISLATMEALRGKKFSKEDFEKYLDENRVHYLRPQNAEEQCLNLVGKELYELLFKGYTEKQWGMSPAELDPSITARIPLRFNHDTRYPQEKHQCYPADGYTKMFENILDHSNISIHLNQKQDSEQILQDREKYDFTLYTGPIDEFFNYNNGYLEYRSLSFKWKYYRNEFVQPSVQINYPNKNDYTRSVEIKHVSGQDCVGTTVCYEYPEKKGEPFYPVLTQNNDAMYRKYKTQAENLSNQTHPIYFLGRLAEFKYYNMDQIFLRSMRFATSHLEKLKLAV